jgi:hypothetical protein
MTGHSHQVTAYAGMTHAPDGLWPCIERFLSYSHSNHPLKAVAMMPLTIADASPTNSDRFFIARRYAIRPASRNAV